MVNVTIYSSTMDPMGYTSCLIGFPTMTYDSTEFTDTHIFSGSITP